MGISAQDGELLQRALDLARQAIGLSSPNPRVGAVVTDVNGKVAGEGFHTFDGMKHAEVIALEKAGDKARGGRLYINLEPCCHSGRTGPCTDRVIAAGIRRVVAAMSDPNPVVAAKGFDRLRAAGVEVHLAEGAVADEARKLNEAFARYILTGRPLVTLKAGMTLDGKIAPPREIENPRAIGVGPASSGWITSEEAREHLQQLRHATDAILVGVGTVIADDPLLTDRTGLPRRRPLLRVIVDSRLRLPLDSRLVKTAKDDVLVFCALAEEKRKRALESRGIRVEQLPMYASEELNVVGGSPIKSAGGRPDMNKLALRLGEMEITSLMIEGGALINWVALAAGIVDKVFLYYAPKILAGTGAVPFAGGEGFQHIADAAPIQRLQLHRFGVDFAVEGYLRDPYAVPNAPEKRPGPVAVHEGA